MKNTTKPDLSGIKFDLFRTWDQISPDAGYCTPNEIAELVIDRLPVMALTVIRAEIDTYGYKKVQTAVAHYFRGM